MEDRKIKVIDLFHPDNNKILIASLKYPVGEAPEMNTILYNKEGKWKIIGIVFSKKDVENVWDCKIEKIENELTKNSILFLNE